MWVSGFLLAVALVSAGAPAFAAESLPCPLFFIEDSANRYLIRAPGTVAVFTRGGVAFEAGDAVVHATFEGASGAMEMEGAEPMGSANFLTGRDPQQWRTGLPTHRKIRYANLYPGIDLTYSGTGSGRVKSEFQVAPGAEPREIRLKYSEDLWIDAGGRLHARGLIEDAPEIYQDTAAGRVRVKGRFRLCDRLTVGFDVKAYDRSLPLVIDPVISYATYMGGTGLGAVTGVALDSIGNLYAAGWTEALNFPIVLAEQASNAGSADAFIAKLNVAGTALVYSTYLGGTGTITPELANGIAVDSTGNAYVAGVTNSTDFPVTTGAYQVAFNGVADAFVTKINPAGTSLVYSTFLGGTSFDWAWGIGIDSGGNAYAAGYTSSGDFAQSNPVQAAFGGFYDAFVAKLNAAGNALGFSTWYGGSGSDVANALAVDANGNMFLGGQTSSLNLPLVGAIQTSNNGSSIGWLARLGVTAPPPQIPSAVSVTPSSGSGNTVVFAAQYTDTGGAAALTTVSLLVNTSAATAFACYVSYNQSTGVLSLANDDPSSGSQIVTFGGGSQQNSQCIVNGAGSSVSVAGSTLTLNVSLTFRPGFGGVKTVYLYAADAGANTGWVARGAWTAVIPPPVPSADTASPNDGSGSSQTFTFVFSDTQNAANLIGLAMLFNTTSATVTNACDIVYDRNAGKVSLLWDSAAGSDSKLISSGLVLQNSQCQVGAVTSAASGHSQILTASITFKGAFSGTKNIYMFASETGQNTGWVLRGTYLVAAGGLPVANSAVPAAGSGPGQRFSFTASDQGGAGFITGMAMLISSSLSTTNACSMVYDRTQNVVSLAFDIPANGAAKVTPGSNTVASNGQCSLNGANTTVVIGITSVVVTVDLAFNADWFGAKNIYLLASETVVNSGFVTVGGWTVTGGGPTADSVAPATGSGASPNFTFTVSDSSSQLNIVGMSMLITAGAPSVQANACYLVYNRVTGTIGLYDDAGTTLSTKPIGSSANLFNAQCAVGFTVMVHSGNSVSFTVNTVFRTFSGAKTVYLQANEPNTNSGWVQRGAWTVP